MSYLPHCSAPDGPNFSVSTAQNGWDIGPDHTLRWGALEGRRFKAFIRWGELGTRTAKLAEPLLLLFVGAQVFAPGRYGAWIKQVRKPIGGVLLLCKGLRYKFNTIRDKDDWIILKDYFKRICPIFLIATGVNTLGQSVVRTFNIPLSAVQKTNWSTITKWVGRVGTTHAALFMATRATWAIWTTRKGVQVGPRAQQTTENAQHYAQYKKNFGAQMQLRRNGVTGDLLDTWKYTGSLLDEHVPEEIRPAFQLVHLTSGVFKSVRECALSFTKTGGPGRQDVMPRPQGPNGVQPNHTWWELLW